MKRLLCLVVVMMVMLSGCGENENQDEVIKKFLGSTNEINVDCAMNMIKKENLSNEEMNILFEIAKNGLDKSYKPKYTESDIEKKGKKVVGIIISLPLVCGK